MMKQALHCKIAATAFIVLGALLFYGCGEKVKPGAQEVKRARVSGLTTEAAAPTLVDEYYETAGTVKAKTVSVVASRMMGAVTSLKVKEGDRVRAGQLLLTVDDSDVSEKVKAADAGYREAQKGLAAAEAGKRLTDITYERYRRLYDEKALSGQELDQLETQKKVADIDLQRAKAGVERAGAGLQEAKVYRSFTRIVSPVRGIVSEKKIEPGSMAVPGTPLLSIEDDSSYRIEANGDESMSGKIRSGMKASVRIDAMDRDIPGKISEVVPSIDPVSRSFLIKIAVSGEGLRNGLYGKVSIPVGKRQALLVPKNAVVEKGALTGVYIIDKDAVIKYRLVKTGRPFGDRVEVLAGLNPGDKVIVGGVERAVDGGVAVERQ